MEDNDMTAAATAEALGRCIGCGKPLEDGRAFRILKGDLEDGEFVEAEEFGVLHGACFHEAVESPDSVLREVKSLSRKTKRKSRRKRP